MAKLLDDARRHLGTLRWYWRGVTGADAYDRYVRYLRVHRPGEPVPSEKEFWRQKYADQDANPTSRCC